MESLMRPIILVSLFLTFPIACDSQSPTSPSKAPDASATPEPAVDRAADDAPAKAATDAAADQIAVEIRDFDGIQELIASKRGKVVVMDCWSTWCDPCVKEFPGLVELHKKYDGKDLACISLSFNYEGGKKETPEEHEEGVLEFLRGQGATFDNVIASVPSEKLYRQLGFKSATVPAIFVYDRQGQVAKQFESDEAKYSEVGKLVAELIEPAAPAE
jgi:thiol-disulfide isomerase/thioredoxin